MKEGQYKMGGGSGEDGWCLDLQTEVLEVESRILV